MLLENDEIEKSFRVLKDFIQKEALVIPDPNVQYAADTPKGFFPAKLSSKNRGLGHLFLPKMITYDPGAVCICASIFLNTFSHHVKSGHLPRKFQLGGIESSSIPLLTAIQTLSFELGMRRDLEFDPHINIFTVRKERRDYGIFNFINGMVEENVQVVFLDDLFNSGSSFRHFVNIVTKEANARVYDGFFCIITEQPTKTFIMEINDKDYVGNSLFAAKEFDFSNEDNIVGKKIKVPCI